MTFAKPLSVDVEHIERQIRELTAEEFSELREWVLERDWSAWDAQIAADVGAGKFDKLLAEHAIVIVHENDFHDAAADR